LSYKVATDALPGHLVKTATQADFCAAGFDALLKQWGKCINVGGGYVEKVFYPRSNMFYISYPFVTYLPTLPVL
jgi:hypothetical protein